MQKIKTVSSMVKRFKKTAYGLKKKKENLRHILTKKSSKRKRHLGSKTYFSKKKSILSNNCFPYL